jgi:hypothetical protein
MKDRRPAVKGLIENELETKTVKGIKKLRKKFDSQIKIQREVKTDRKAFQSETSGKTHSNP